MPERPAPTPPAATPGPAPAVHAAGFDELDRTTAYRLWQLRSLVFVVEQDCPYLDLDGRDLEPATVHLWVEDEAGTPVATLRLLDDGDVAREGRPMPLPALRYAVMTRSPLATGGVEVYDGREVAPAGATPDMFLDDGSRPLPFAQAVVTGRATGVPVLR